MTRTRLAPWPRHMHAHDAFLSRMHRARTARRSSAYTLAVARADTWCWERARESRRRDEERRRAKGRRDERGITVARKGFNESCLLLAQIATSTEKISIPTSRPISLILSFSRLTLFHVVTGANGAAGLSTLIRGEQFAVKRAYD